MPSITHTPNMDLPIVEHNQAQEPEQPNKIEQNPIKEEFSGFQEGNGYTQFNHAMFDEMLSQISNVAELKVVMYVHRHTVGYHQKEVGLSVEEFALGRERQNGERYDRGTGLCPRSVKSGIKRALEHGYIERHQQGNTVYFSLNMATQPKQTTDDQANQEGQNLHPSTDATEGQNLPRNSAKFAPATGKTCTQRGQNLHPSTRSAPHSGRSTGRSRSAAPPAKETERNSFKEREKERGVSLPPSQNSSFSSNTSARGDYQKSTDRHDPQQEEKPASVEALTHEERVKANLERYAALLAKTRKNEAA